MRAEVTRELTQLRAEFGFSDRAMDSIIHFVQRLQTRTALALGVSEEDVAEGVGVPMRGVTAKRMRAQEQRVTNELVRIASWCGLNGVR
jgi:hypothetical protein